MTEPKEKRSKVEGEEEKVCKDAGGHYCPNCRYWENAYGKMGY